MSVRLPLFVLAMTLSACTQFPELDGTLDDTDKDAPYPRLAPKSELEKANKVITITPAVTEGINDRVAALKARVKAMRGSAMTPQERARLEDAIDR